MVEYEDGMVRFGFDKPAMARALITKDYRLTLFKGESFGELYDLGEDPQENHNRFDDSDYEIIKAELTAKLAQEMMKNMETSPQAPRRA
jgi:hypothetical protein